MGLDLRKPIGYFFLLLGVILVGQGVLTSGDTAMYTKSLDYNINLIWGVVLVVFGLAMLIPALLCKGGGK
jgi:protein-S-isoprenylcysteine O-methyltransferase Ste14